MMKHPSPLYDITPFTLLDYPGKTACIFWFPGCNMRCPYCYNPNILFGKGTLPFKNAASFLLSRKNLLDGVVFSGGECTLHPSMFAYANMAKKQGMLIKIDTNGSRPDVISRLLDISHIDFVSLDFKAPKEHYEKVSGSQLFDAFHQTLNILISSHCAFEVRTTVHGHLLNRKNLEHMVSFLEKAGYRNPYFIQQAITTEHMLSPLPKAHDYSWLRTIDSHLFSVILRNTTF